MTDALTPIAMKIAKCIRLLSSDKAGEVLAAANALNRTLTNAGADIHVLADRIEKPNGGGGLTKVEMRKLYDAGYNDGVRAAENKQYDAAGFRNVDDTPAWHEIARFCQGHSDRLQEKERTFINDMSARTVWREPTEKQAKWLKSIFYRLGGKP
jgi:hypothetical protein